MRALLPLTALLLASSALAAPSKPRLLVDAPGPMRTTLSKALRDQWTLVPAKPALRSQPVSGEVHRACSRARAEAALAARLQPSGTWSLLVLDCADGQPRESFSLPGGKKRQPPRTLPRAVLTPLLAALEQAGASAPPMASPPASPPATPAPASLAPAPSALAAPAPSGPAVAAPSASVPTAEVPRTPALAAGPSLPVALRLSVGGRAFSRRFYFTDDLFGALGAYRLRLAPSALVDAEWYPATHFTSGPASAVGLSLGAESALGLSSVAPDGTVHSTRVQRLRAALQVRLRAGTVELTPFAGFVWQAFSVADIPGIPLPDVEVRGLRAGLSARAPLWGPLGLTAHAAGIYPLSTGELGSSAWFPRMVTGGLDASAGLTFALQRSLELRLTGEYFRLWSTLNPEPGDAFIAGGALDFSWGATLAVTLSL
ncbi:hypothetical protein ACN28I_11100 [Archangium gephyra]|uniref:hypothetical protein n=1 Tax=Archangium gephyra TaxID=48 RepID=UPI003B7ED075